MEYYTSDECQEVAGAESNLVQQNLLPDAGAGTLRRCFRKVFPRYKEQVILRPEWRLDLFYFIFNRLLITALLLVGNYFAASVFGWAINDAFQGWIHSTPILAQVLILVFCAVFVLYWSHRTFQESKKGVRPLSPYISILFTCFSRKQL